MNLCPLPGARWEGTAAAGPLPSRQASEPWSCQGVYRLLERLTETVGPPHPVDTHQLRDTFLTLAARSGVPTEDVASQAGHASIQTTMRYYRALEEHSAYPTHAVLDAVGGRGSAKR